MLKRLILLVLFSLSLFASINDDFLEPEQAFKTKFIEQEDKIIFTLNLGKAIYLYDDKLKVFITKPQKIELTKEINLPKPVEYDGFIVHFVNQNIQIPKELLKSKIDSSFYEIEVQFQGCSKAGLCYAPMSETYTINKNNSQVSKNQLKEDVNISETDSIANTLLSGNIFLVLATFFGFGLLLSLTPCVFPMIPILSSIIVKAGNNSTLTPLKGFFLSFIYVFFMSLAYTIAGIIAGLFGANLQVALQNPYVLIVFALIFVALAFSMFGYYKLELPQSIQNKINKTTDGKEKQGILGIAIMGFLSALIVGPCVAPPLAGALVYIGQTGDAILGGLALFVLSFGMGLPLLLIGLGAGKFMPKPGGWMDSVSKIFGIVMLGIAIWMLERVIPEYTLFLWSFLLIGSAIYLKEYKHIVAKTITSIIFIYGVISFVGAISGAKDILKPLEKFTQIKAGSNFKTNSSLNWIKVKNLQELDKQIKASSKPVMLDFYADWCVACKELEEITFTNKEVVDKLQGFTLLKADVTKNTKEDKELQKKYGIFGPPGLIFWNKENQEVKEAKIVGFKTPEEFLQIINKSF
ncbi:thiol:disulfide interchange protein [Malaciobacter mytili LMG 24559]|uniref:Thiol:disulfide interchange protein n=1 Tax=Malaciobacter mytili LMG 24559 TaxID=1032238 RepID=A0AAX2AFM3_9BACT|nr:protein-disulfide reductase DsbD [Malaciobacter mytili]AXH16093.1 thiol:disulfide interchange protein DsbD [Malaciobacter mytili LMG 24559]RXK14929.1 thiol:disulfide interchange protein [Malaciobacter mytili LMG 24559]